jgi:hypothetical protein
MGFRVVPSIGLAAKFTYSWSIDGPGQLTSQSLQSNDWLSLAFQGAGPVQFHSWF